MRVKINGMETIAAQYLLKIVEVFGLERELARDGTHNGLDTEDSDGRTQSSLEETGNATFLASSTPEAPSTSTKLQTQLSLHSTPDGTLPNTSANP
jgi:hypothetical protein